MRELPRGTVTFLFTDIEGSTRLLRKLGGRYSEAFKQYRRVLRDVHVAGAGSGIARRMVAAEDQGGPINRLAEQLVNPHE